MTLGGVDADALLAYAKSVPSGRIKLTKTMKLSRIPAPKWAELC